MHEVILDMFLFCLLALRMQLPWHFNEPVLARELVAFGWTMSTVLDLRRDWTTAELTTSVSTTATMARMLESDARVRIFALYISVYLELKHKVTYNRQCCVKG